MEATARLTVVVPLLVSIASMSIKHGCCDAALAADINSGVHTSDHNILIRAKDSYQTYAAFRGE